MHSLTEKLIRPEKIIPKFADKNKKTDVNSGKRFINEILIECNNRERLIDEDAINNDLNNSATIGPPFVCIICKQWFLSKEKLLIHYIGNHEKIPCHMCLLVFDTRELCTIHENKAHYPLYCELCHNEFIDLQILEMHYKSAHNTMSCRFCNLLIQPQACYTTHINRKHNVYDEYNQNENLLIIDQWFDDKWNFRCRMCNKIRPKKDVYGHFRMHHKITANSFINVIQYEEIELELNGSIDEVVPMKKITLKTAEVKSETTEECSICANSKVPLIFHQVYCMKKFACHYCFETFDNSTHLHTHKELGHRSFRCDLGCENIVSINERELDVHYKKFHDVIACKFCEVCVHADQNKYIVHLINEHSVKDLAEIFDTDLLFQETLLNNNRIIVCSLCEQNITDLMQNVDGLYSHFNEQHSIILKTIVSYNQSNPFSTNKIEPKSNPEEHVPSHDEDENNKDIEIGGIFEDIDPKYIECSIYDGNSDDENYDQLLKIKEEPLDDFDDDLIPLNDSSDLICELCEFKFSSKNDLLEHIHAQHGFNANLSCNDCLKSFVNESELELHIDNTHRLKEGDLNCPFCTLVSFKKHIQRHLQMEHSQEIETNLVTTDVGYKCRFCDELFWKQMDRNFHEIKKHFKFNEHLFVRCFVCYEVFSREYSLRKHMEESHEQKFDLSKIVYKCLQCYVLLPHLQTMKEHFSSQHSELVIYKCAYDNCTFWNSTKSAIEMHIKEKHKKSKEKNLVVFTPKPCEMCGKHLCSQRSAKIHYRMKHTGERIGFGCRLCSERFDTIEKRKLHYTMVHSGIRAFICSVCGKGFNSKSGLYGHKQLHNNNSFECEYCHKIFVRKDTYSEHILIHSGPRHQCQHCSRSFTQRSNLIRHTRIHTGEKPYQCPMCPKKFSDKGACNSHVRVHTREEVCSCPFCGKTYSKKQKLKYHLKTHTGEQLGKKQSGEVKTLICSECNEGFSDERYLHRHIITSHVEMACNYKCQVCNQKFITQNHLNSHTLSHFGVKHIKCLLCEAAYASNESIIDHLREDHKISNEEVGKYFKQLSSEDVEKLLTTCLEKDSNSVNIVFSDIKPGNIPSPQKQKGNKDIKAKKTNNKRRKKEIGNDINNIEFGNTLTATKNRQVKKPIRYVVETNDVKLPDPKKPETIVNVDKFLEVNIKEEIVDDYDSEKKCGYVKYVQKLEKCGKKSGAWFFRGLPQYVLPPNSKLLQQQNQPHTSHVASIIQHSTKFSAANKQEDTGGGSSGSDDDCKKSSFYSKPTKVVKDLSSERISGSFDHQQSYHQKSPNSRQSTVSESGTTRSTLSSVTFFEPPQYIPGEQDYERTYSLSGSDSLHRRDSITSKSDNTSSADDKASLSNISTLSGGSSLQHCTVHRAKNLTPMDINGLSDPFCKLNILPTNNPSTRLRTKTVHKTRNPEFNETVTFYGITDNDIMKKSLHVLVLDDDKYGYDFMGESKIALNGLRAQSSLKVSATLCGPSPAGDYAPDTEHICSLWGDVPNTRGQILLALTYSTKKRALVIGIIRCSHLPPMDSNGFSDPFVKLHLSPDPHHKKYKTSIKWKTLNPVFNEEFTFETRPNELTTQSLRLTVWDKDYGKSNDYLGGLILGSMSKGKRLKHWLNVIKFPDHRHEAWHYLTEDMVTD